MNKKEIWKDIDGCKGIYQVSNLGRVKSLKKYDKYNGNIKEKILSLKSYRAGYPVVTLYKNGVYKNFYVHQLVANAFLKNTNDYPEINHKNGIKTDNRVENLEFCTYSHNNKEAYRLGLNKVSKKVNQYDLNNNFIKQWNSVREAEKELHILASSISRCCQGFLKTAGRFK